MKLTDQPKNVLKAIEQVVEKSAPKSEKEQQLSRSLTSRYDTMKPKQINELFTRTPEDEKAIEDGRRKFRALKQKTPELGDETLGLPIPSKQPRKPKGERSSAEIMKDLKAQMDDMNRKLDSTEGKLKAVDKVQTSSPVATSQPKKRLPYQTDYQAAENERNRQAEPTEAPKTKPEEAPKPKLTTVAPEKIEVPKMDTTEPKLAELPKIEPVKAKEEPKPAQAEPAATPVDKVEVKGKKLRYFNPYTMGSEEGGHGFQSQIPYYDKPYEPGMQPAGYQKDVGNRWEPQEAPDDEDAVTKGVKKVASKLASFFKKKEEPDQDMKRPMGTQKEHVEIEEAKLHPMAVHLAAANSTHYHVKAVGSKLADGLRVGEKLNDTEVDDLTDMGAKVKHLKEDTNMDKTQLIVEKMMKKLHKKLDPVGREDADVDNDGDSDKSDSYLKNRREKITAAVKEELVGNQHRIDANKNNKIDAQDFKLLRKQRATGKVLEKLRGKGK